MTEQLVVSIKQMVFYTQINKTLMLQNDAMGSNCFANASKPIYSKGFETNLKWILKEDLKFFVGYTFIDAKATYLTGKQFLPLLPMSKLNLSLVYEKEGNFKVGLESYFTGGQ